MSGPVHGPRRLRWGLLLWVGVWVSNVLLVALSVGLLRAGWVAPAWQPVVALLPAVPLPPGLVLFMVLVSRMDEFRQRLTVGSFALAASVVGIVVYGWSLLGWVGAPRVPTVWVLPAELLIWGALMLALRVPYP